MNVTAVLLAAGQGTRMRSSLPKVMHLLLGQPMVQYSLQAATQVTGQKPVVVVGFGAETVRQALGDAAQCVLQEPQLGTGHAVQQAAPLLQGKTDLVLVTFADMPLLTAETLQKIVDAQQSHTGPATMLTLIADDPRGFGRV